MLAQADGGFRGLGGPTMGAGFRHYGSQSIHRDSLQAVHVVGVGEGGQDARVAGVVVFDESTRCVDN